MIPIHDPLTDFTKEDVSKTAGRLYERLAASLFPMERPRAVLLGGQPGAGKTTMTHLFQEKFQNNAMVVSGDHYRCLHPNHEKLVERYGKDATPAANAFSGAVTEELIALASAAQYDLIVEGTFRTAEVPLNTCRILKERGYRVDAACLAVKPELSYFSTLYRYELMKESGMTPRATSKEAHDQTVRALPGNLNTLYASGLFDTIQLYTRGGERVYDSGEDEYFPGEALKTMYRASWTAEEVDALLETIDRTERLMAQRNAPELPAFLRERAGAFSQRAGAVGETAEQEM